MTLPERDSDYDFVISVNNLPEKLGFSPEFQAELEAVGGNIHCLATKLLNSSNLNNSGKFKARQLFATPEQLEFYSKTLDAGPMVTCWLTTCYEIPFTQVHTKTLYAKNNKIIIDVLAPHTIHNHIWLKNLLK